MHLIVRMVLFFIALKYNNNTNSDGSSRSNNKISFIQVDCIISIHNKWQTFYFISFLFNILFLFIHFFADELADDSDSDSRDSKTGFRVIQTLHANNNSLRNASYGVI